MAKPKSKSKGEVKISLQNLSMPELNYPVFCFKHLQTKPDKDYKFYTEFILRLVKLCNLSWKEIDKTHKHSFGTEKMEIKFLKPDMPSFVTPDMDSLTVFRANGDNRPFLGIRRSNVFHILFIEEQFGDVYDH